MTKALDSKTIDGKEIVIFFGKNGYAERVGLNNYVAYLDEEKNRFVFDSDFISLACSVVSLLKLNLLICNYRVKFLDSSEDVESEDADFVAYELAPFFIAFEITEKGRQILHCVNQKKIEELKRKFKTILSFR